MRIISGTHKGRRLTAPSNLPIRPTTDFAKEALFNILGNRFYFDELTVLDLYAGTGNISFEFASRGVTEITDVDAHNGCIAYIGKVAEEFDFPITTVKMDAEAYLEKTNGKFDIIFADPPYHIELEHFQNMVKTVFERNLLKQEGVLIIEHRTKLDLSELLNFAHSRKYGNSTFSFFEVANEEE